MDKSEKIAQMLYAHALQVGGLSLMTSIVSPKTNQE